MALPAITNSAASASENVFVSWKRSVFVLNLTTEWQPSPQAIQQIPTAPLPTTNVKKMPRGGGSSSHCLLLARPELAAELVTLVAILMAKKNPRSGPTSASR